MNTTQQGGKHLSEENLPLKVELLSDFQFWRAGTVMTRFYVGNLYKEHMSSVWGLSPLQIQKGIKDGTIKPQTQSHD